MSQTITACLVVYNEESIIRRCMESIKDVVDEIVIVHDGPCTDNTLNICKEYTNKIFVRPRVKIAEPHRVFAYEQATKNWVLHIDADEYLSDELHENIRELVKDENVDLYRFIWPFTDGVKDLTAGIQHPYRNCLARRSKLYFFGLPRHAFSTYGNAKNVPLIMKHRPQYNKYTWYLFRTKWLPTRNKLEAEYVWKNPSEIPVYGVNDDKAIVEVLESYRSKPLRKIPYLFLRTFIWHLYKGMWKIGFLGIKLAFLLSIDLVSVRYYIYKYKH